MSHNNKKSKHYWFRAKRYGWGWGLPLTWQGWVVYIAYTGFLVAGACIFPHDKNKACFLLLILAFSLTLIGIGWVKGEPTRWRWGKDKDGK